MIRTVFTLSLLSIATLIPAEAFSQTLRHNFDAKNAASQAAKYSSDLASIVRGVPSRGGSGTAPKLTNAQIAAKQKQLSGLITQVDKRINEAKKFETSAANTVKQQTAKLASVSAPAREAQARTRKEAAEMLAYEKKLETSQQVSSQFRAVREQYLGAQKAYQDLVASIEGSTEYQQAYQTARASENRASDLAAVRNKFLVENPKLRVAESELKESLKSYEKSRLELLRGDSTWQSYQTSLADAKENEAKYENAVKSAAGQRSTAKKQLDTAKSFLVSVQRTKAEMQSVMRRLQAMKTKPQNNRGNQGKKKKKK